MNAKFSKVILVVLDGFGISSSNFGNAITSSKPKFISELVQHYPTFVLQASGPVVGLPWGESGNSEVGHLCIGAGRVVIQDLARINHAIESGLFFENDILLKAMNNALDKDKTLHLVGLVGSGNVHSYHQHLYSLLRMAKELGVANVSVHAFTDGRDAPPKSSIESLEKLKQKIAEIGIGTIASISGRFFGMDRAGHADLTQMAFNAIVNGVGEKFVDVSQAILSRYDKGITDEMIPPTVFTNSNGSPLSIVNENDSVIFFNFRNDRMIQMTKKFRDTFPKLEITTMTSYSPDLNVNVVFGPLQIDESLGELISMNGWKQFRAAESEKFAHVTFFFNGHRHEPWPGEEREIISSPKGNTYNYVDIPAMSAVPLTDAVINRIENNDDKFILVNYANGDMIGHTGNLTSTKNAVLVLDECLNRLANIASQTNSLLIITADHGNCETMIDPRTGDISTEHTSNPVPLIFYSNIFRTDSNNLTLDTLAGQAPQGILSDIAPTILYFLGIEKPLSMTGNVIFTGEEK